VAVKHPLLTSQKNEILALITEVKLDPSHFEWQEVTSKNVKDILVSKLAYASGDFFCTYDVYSDPFGNWNRQTSYSPSPDLTVDSRWLESWQDQIDVCRGWLRTLAKEVAAPDLWASITADRSLVVALSYAEDDNSSFSQIEQQNIAVQLAEIKSLIIASTQLGQEKIGLVEGRLAYLQDSSQRLGRKDWRILTLGVVVTIILQLTLSPENARELWGLISILLVRLFGGPPQLPM
jgi:hypothetical protein